VSVTDPIFDSVWDATLWELAAEPGIWEPFWDSANFFTGACDDILPRKPRAKLRRQTKGGEPTRIKFPLGSTRANSRIP
jgi:hypothetical protein